MPRGRARGARAPRARARGGARVGRGIRKEGGNETWVSGTSVARARGADAWASAKRGALVSAEGDEHHRSTRRRVGATKETTVDDLPVRLPPRVLSCPHLVEAYFSNILLTATTARPRPCPSRADLARSSRPPPRADAGPPARGGLRPPRRGLEAARVLRRHAHVRPRARSPRRTTRETRLALVFRETQRKTKTFFFRLRIRLFVGRGPSTLHEVSKETPRFFLVTTRIRREDVKVFTSVATSSDHSLVSHRLYVALTLCAPRTYTMCIRVSFKKKKKNVTGARVSAPRVSANTRWRARTSRCWTSKPRSGSAARAPSPTPPSPPGQRAPRFSSAASTSTARDRTRTRATQGAWRLKPGPSRPRVSTRARE